MTLGIGDWCDLYDQIVHDPARCPQLFLYSRADALIPAADVEELMEARRRKGVEVKQMVWADSPHIRHFTFYPEVYAKTCQDFAQACLATTGASLTSLAILTSRACLTSRVCLTSRACLTSQMTASRKSLACQACHLSSRL